MKNYDSNNKITDGQSRCQRCNHPISDPTQKYGPYCAQLLGLTQPNILTDTSAVNQGVYDENGNRVILDNQIPLGYTGYETNPTLAENDSKVILYDFSQRVYDRYEEKYLSEGTEVAKVSLSENFGSWFSKQWDNVKWAFESVGYYANEAQKEAQRAVWKLGSKLYLQKKNLFTSAWMLEHSLQDNPDDIWRGNDSRIAYLINHDKNFSDMNSNGGWSKTIGTGTVANDAAVISQKSGAIRPYHVTVDFWITR